MSGYPTRLPLAIFTQDLNQANIENHGNITATTAGGVAVPKGFRHELAHLALTKKDTCTLKIWGMSNLGTTAARWVYLDVLDFSEAGNECQAVRGVAAFDRVQCSVNGVGATNINSYWGFSE